MTQLIFKFSNLKDNLLFILAVMINTLMEVFPLILISILLNIIESKKSLLEITGLNLSNVLWVALLLLLLVFFGFCKFFIQHRINLFIESIRHIASLDTLQNISFFRSNQDGRLDKNARKVLSDSDFLVSSYSGPIGRVISGTTMAISVFLILCYQNFNLAVICLTAVFIPYLIIHLTFIKLTKQVGEKRQLKNSIRFQACLNILVLWKESKIFNFENKLLDKFSTASESFYRSIALNTSLNNFPKYFLELFLTIIIFVYLLNTSILDNTFKLEAISFADFGVVIFAVLKLLPTSHQIFSGLAMIRYGSSSNNNFKFSRNSQQTLVESSNLTIGNFLRINEIEYYFEQKIFKISNLVITGNSFIVGESGCGKSSFIDILSGLKKSEKYEIENQFGKKMSASQIQSSISICSQFPKFFDGSIYENIVFSDRVNIKRLNKIIDICQLKQFNVKKFNENFQNSFSGGELQRIALARALYKPSELLVLDEPTSALSEDMAREIMDNIQIFYNGILLVISHNNSIIKDSFNVIKFNRICKS